MRPSRPTRSWLRNYAVIDINGNPLVNEFGSAPGRGDLVAQHQPSGLAGPPDRAREGRRGLRRRRDHHRRPGRHGRGHRLRRQLRAGGHGAVPRPYLAERYTLDELKSKLGVPSLDLATFDYGHYIRSSPAGGPVEGESLPRAAAQRVHGNGDGGDQPLPHAAGRHRARLRANQVRALLHLLREHVGDGGHLPAAHAASSTTTRWSSRSPNSATPPPTPRLPS